MPDPLCAFSLHNPQLLVQVANIHPRQDVPLSGAAQAGALHTAHFDAVFAAPRPGRGGRYQVGDGPVIHGGAELFQGFPDALQNTQLPLPVGDSAAQP